MRSGSSRCGPSVAPNCSTGWRRSPAGGWPRSIGMTQADFDAPSWTPVGRDETYGRFMRIRHYDCFMHEHDIRDALGMPSRPEVDDLDSALDEVSTGLGYIVGRRASMPEGSRVQIDLTGPVDRVYLVSVDGRATLVDSFDGPPTVGIAAAGHALPEADRWACRPRAGHGGAGSGSPATVNWVSSWSPTWPSPSE